MSKIFLKIKKKFNMYTYNIKIGFSEKKKPRLI